MTATLLFAGRSEDWPAYRAALETALARRGQAARVVHEADPAEVDYIAYAPSGPVQDFAPFTRLRAVFSLWAGVERIVTNSSLKVPLTRMVDSGLTEGMVEYVAGHVLRHHLGLDTFILGQDGIWRGSTLPPLARNRPVALLGLGALGEMAGLALTALGFPVTGWSRRPRDVPGLRCLSGPGALEEVLRNAQILVTLLPATQETENLLSAHRLALLPRGAAIINPGRGSLIDEAALLAALDDGQVGHATLDVFRTEPLPPEHPFWAHPRVTVTPHVAAATRPETAADVIAENLFRAEQGLPLLYPVDRAAGY